MSKELTIYALFLITWVMMYFMFERSHEMQIQIMSWQMDINENQQNIDANIDQFTQAYNFGGM